MSNPSLKATINPNDDLQKFDQLLNDTELDNLIQENNFNDAENTWIQSLKKLVNKEINISLNIDEKQERTTGRNMGHYKTLLECIRQNDPMIPILIPHLHCINLSYHGISSEKMAIGISTHAGKR
jgi:hypothetical protein